MASKRVPWRTLLMRFAILGVSGFGGPPAHVAQMRRQWVTSGDLTDDEFTDAFAAASLLPGPASTQTALWVGWRTRGLLGMISAGLLFIVPSVALVTLLATQLRATGGIGLWIAAAARGAAIAVPSVALWAGVNPLRDAVRADHAHDRDRFWRLATALVGFAGGLASTWVNPVFVILAAGLVTLTFVERVGHPALFAASKGLSLGLAGLALKVGALSFGGGFVIVAMMRSDAVTTHHWLSDATFASAVALGQITPGPVVATIAAIGYFAGGTLAAIGAAALAFAPSFVFVGLGAPLFARLRASRRAAAFFLGASSSALGLIIASGWLVARGFTTWWEWVGAAVAAGAGAKFRPLPLLAVGSLVGIAHLALTL